VKPARFGAERIYLDIYINVVSNPINAVEGPRKCADNHVWGIDTFKRLQNIKKQT
jgi:hypothetical protein